MGNVVIGNIGSPYYMDYTTIGDEVYIADRLQSIAKGGCGSDKFLWDTMYKKPLKTSFRIKIWKYIGKRENESDRNI